MKRLYIGFNNDNPSDFFDWKEMTSLRIFDFNHILNKTWQNLLNEEIETTLLKMSTGDMSTIWHNFKAKVARFAKLHGFMGSEAVFPEFEHLMNDIWVLGYEYDGLVDTLIKKLEKLSCIKFVEPERRYKLHSPTNDPSYPNQSKYPFSNLKLENAWTITQGNGDIIVAVVDTGVDYKHPDLIGNMWQGNDFHGCNYVDVKEPPMDKSGHGTNVAGIIGAVINNGVGIAGIADVRIMAIKTLVTDGETDTTAQMLYNAIVFAANNGAKIINNSWGPETSLASDAYPVIQAAVDEALKKGAVCVFSAGNDGKSVDDKFPCILKNVITVSASDNKDKLVEAYNYGQKITIAAPGKGVPTLTLSSESKNHVYMDGTSASAPFVSGALALLFSKRADLLINTSEPLPAQVNKIKNLLKTTSKKMKTSNLSKETGLLNIYDLLNQ